jgi:hypothetical protein
MSLARSVAEILGEHVVLEVECIDRMYLNVYVPQLQTERGIACFFKFHRGHTFASSAVMLPMTNCFLTAIGSFIKKNDIPLVAFEKGQRKDEVAAEHLARFKGDEGVLFVGRAQEKASVVRTERRYHNPQLSQSRTGDDPLVRTRQTCRIKLDPFTSKIIPQGI